MIHCTVCGATLRPATSDLPFKVREHTIVIVKNLPVLECQKALLSQANAEWERGIILEMLNFAA